MSGGGVDNIKADQYGTAGCRLATSLIIILIVTIIIHFITESYSALASL